jgi:hypothetical protein
MRLQARATGVELAPVIAGQVFASASNVAIVSDIHPSRDRSKTASSMA